MADKKIEFVGRARVPLREHPPRNTISVEETLADLKSRPPLGMEELEPTALMIGIEIQRARKRLGLTQEALAERSSIPQGRISAIEAGKGSNGPTVEIVQRLAEVLDLRLLLSQNEPPAEQSLASCLHTSNPGNIQLADASYDIDMAFSLFDTLVDHDVRKRLRENMQRLTHVSIPHVTTCRSTWGVWRALPHSSAMFWSSMHTIVAVVKGNGEVLLQQQKTGDKKNVTLACPGDVVTVSNNAAEPFGFLTLMLDEGSLQRFFVDPND